MKVFLCELYQSCSGGWIEKTVAVVANHESTALGKCLEKYPYSSADEWTIIEIDMSVESLQEVHSYSH